MFLWPEIYYRNLLISITYKQDFTDGKIGFIVSLTFQKSINDVKGRFTVLDMLGHYRLLLTKQQDLHHDCGCPWVKPYLIPEGEEHVPKLHSAVPLSFFAVT